jgi:hypothetical protein
MEMKRKRGREEEGEVEEEGECLTGLGCIRSTLHYLFPQYH